jgi:hypothetical protein
MVLASDMSHFLRWLDGTTRRRNFGSLGAVQAAARPCYARDMSAEDIEEAILRLPPHELAKLRAWFADFEAGRKPPEPTASKIGRLAGRAFADIRKRMREP